MGRGWYGPNPVFGMRQKSAILTNALFRFTIVVLDGVLGPRHLAEHTHTVSLFI